MSTLRNKLNGLEGDQPSRWKEAAAYRKENRSWLNISLAIALRVLDVLQEQGLSLGDLAERMGVSLQHVNKIVKGQENLTIESISNLELALGINIIGAEISRKGAV